MPAHRPRLIRNVVTKSIVAAALVSVIAILGGCSESARQPSAAPPRTGAVWVADEGADSLTVINAATDTVAMTLDGITGPHNVQVGSDGTVYAVSSAGAVVAIDPTTYRVTATAPAGPSPAHVIEAPGGKVYVTNSGDGTVSVYRARTLRPAGRITLGGMPHGMRAAAGGSVIVVANTAAGAVDLIDPATDTSSGAITVGASPAQVAVSADGRYAYAGVSDPPAVVKIDLTRKEVVDRAPVPTPPVQLFLTPDETTLLCANQGTRDAPGNTLSVIDAASMSDRAQVTTGSGPHGVVIDDSGNWAWVTNTFDDTVSVVDLRTLSVAATVPVGMRPNGVSYSTRPPSPAPVTELAIPVPATAAPAPHDHGH